MIPRIIHQTYPTKDPPPVIRQNIETLCAANPGWRHLLHDDRDIQAFIAEQYGAAVLLAYNRIDPAYGAARADLFRYLLMYRHGGVYLDIKSSSSVALDHLIRPDDRYLLSHWHREQDRQRGDWGLHPELAHIPQGEFEQWYIVCAPGHPFLRAVIERVLGNIQRYQAFAHGVGRMGVLRVTGPIAYTLAIAPLLEAHQHRFWQNREESGFIYSVVDPSNPDSYRSLFRTHYTALHAPVVRTGALKTALIVAAVGLKHAATRLRRRAR